MDRRSGRANRDRGLGARHSPRFLTAATGGVSKLNNQKGSGRAPESLRRLILRGSAALMGFVCYYQKRRRSEEGSGRLLRGIVGVSGSEKMKKRDLKGGDFTGVTL